MKINSRCFFLVYTLSHLTRHIYADTAFCSLLSGTVVCALSVVVLTVVQVLVSAFQIANVKKSSMAKAKNARNPKNDAAGNAPLS